MVEPTLRLNGVGIWKGRLSGAEQQEILSDLRGLAKSAPFQQYQTGRGHKMSVRMSAAGDLGWVSDRRGYRYEPTQKSGAACLKFRALY